MALSAVMEKLDDIPEQYRDLYAEKDGKWELTGITGVKTEADVTRLRTTLDKERKDHKETRGKLEVWGELKHDEVVASLDRIPELEAAGKDKLDEAKIDEIADKRAQGIVKSRTVPLERLIKTLTAERDEFKDSNGKFQAADRTRTIHDDIRKALVKSKVIQEAHEDALDLADKVFEIREDDNKVVTKDGVGLPPGLDAAGWLTEIQDRRPHWWPASVGGGSQGSRGGGGLGGQNPWSDEHWNMTAQSKFFQEHGAERAAAMAKAAGTTVGGARPRPKKVTA